MREPAPSATAVGLHVTDAQALVEILGAQDRGAPLTQSELSQRVGPTAGATSSLLDRLESVGHIRRVRDSADRRVVTLHADESVEALLDRFFAPLVERMSAVMDRYPPEVLQQFERFLIEVCATMDGYLDEQRASPTRLTRPGGAAR